MKESQKQVKCCPRCGSANITFAPFFKPSVWICLDCGYEGAFIVEDSELAEKIREKFAHALEECSIAVPEFQSPTPHECPQEAKS